MLSCAWAYDAHAGACMCGCVSCVLCGMCTHVDAMVHVCGAHVEMLLCMCVVHIIALQR